MMKMRPQGCFRQRTLWISQSPSKKKQPDILINTSAYCLIEENEKVDVGVHGHYL
jgi:hypothetical protein